jgi:hypothetical protein
MEFAVSADQVFDGTVRRHDCAVVVEDSRIRGVMHRSELPAAIPHRHLPTGVWLTRLSQLDSDLGNFADGLNGNWLIGLVRSRKNSGKAAAVPTK